MAKAKKIETFYDKYFNTVVYEYRGNRYEVTYAKGWQICCTPAWIQHRDAQVEIDKRLDNPVTESAENKESKPFDMDEIWELMGWD